MKMKNLCRYLKGCIFAISLSGMVSSCAMFNSQEYDIDDQTNVSSDSFDYKIGPGDTLDIFVWRNPEVSSKEIPVRPDGKISAPLVDSLMASGKTPVELANDIQVILSEYIKDPLVTVTMKNIRGGFEQQVRVVGEAANPAALPYSKDMTVLDVIIAVGGLTEFADGNKSTIVRNTGAEQKVYNVRLDDLLKSGHVEENMAVQPGDILVIPEAWF